MLFASFLRRAIKTPQLVLGEIITPTYLALPLASPAFPIRRAPATAPRLLSAKAERRVGTVPAAAAAADDDGRGWRHRVPRDA